MNFQTNSHDTFIFYGGFEVYSSSTDQTAIIALWVLPKLQSLIAERLLGLNWMTSGQISITNSICMTTNYWFRSVHQLPFCHANGKRKYKSKQKDYDWLSGRLVHRLNYRKYWWWIWSSPSNPAAISFVPEAFQESLEMEKWTDFLV